MIGGEFPIAVTDVLNAEGRHSATPDVYTFSIVPSRYYLQDLFPLKKYEFEGTCFYGPNNPGPFLTCCYGDYMQLPPVEQRRVHSIDVTFLEEK